MNIKVAFCITLQLLFVIFKVVTGVITETEDNLINYENSAGKDLTVSPMVLLVYVQNEEDFFVIYTDLETMKATALSKSSPLDYMNLASVALLCPASAEKENLNDVFSSLSLTKRIKTDKVYPICKRNLKPAIFRDGESSLYKIGYKVENTVSAKTDSNTSQTSTEEDEEMDSNTLSEMILNSQFRSLGSAPHEIYNVELYYNFDLMTSTMSKHFLNAHMHSNDYPKKCDDLALGLEVFKDKIADFESTMFSNLSGTHPDYILHQLAPFQDFKGEYATVSTCTYLNFTLLHKQVVEGPLQRLEILLRNIADIAGHLEITTGTYQAISEVSNSDSNEETISIPTILWKKIAYFAADSKEFSILMVIHNKETSRICDKEGIEEELGWPESNLNEEGIGTMYYCLVNEANVDAFRVPPRSRLVNDPEMMSPFNLNKIPFPSSINILEAIEKAKNHGGSV